MNMHTGGSRFSVQGARVLFTGFIVVLGVVSGSGAVSAQAPMLTLKATSANVAVPGTPVSIQLLRWSSDEERTPLLSALSPPPPAPVAPAPAPTASSATPTEPAAGRAARGGRAAGRGGRAGRGGAGAPPNPIANLSAAIAAAPTIGYLWTDAITGYSIKYAWRSPLANGGERIVLATDRRLGAHSPAWTLARAVPPGAVPPGSGPPGAVPPDYDFTIIEMQLDAKGLGEAKTSLTTQVVADAAAKTLALDGYAAAPALLKVTR
jgi:hypothetical protein